MTKYKIKLVIERQGLDINLVIEKGEYESKMDSNNTREKFDRVILVDYLQNTFSSNDMLELKDCLTQGGFILEEHVHKQQYIAGIEELFAQIQIILSPDFVNIIGTGLLTNGMYDAMKIFLQKIYFKMNQIRLTKMQSGKEIKEVLPAIHFNVGNMKVTLPLDIDNGKYEYFVDKLFEYLASNTSSKEGYGFWNQEKEEIEHYTKSEITRKIYSEYKEKHE